MNPPIRNRLTLSMMIAFALPLGAALSGCGSGAGEQESKMTSFTSNEAKADTAELFTVPKEQLAHLQIVPAEKGVADVSLFATGSEVCIAVEARKFLRERGVSARVVSVPCFELFRKQRSSVRDEVIGAAKVNVAVEAAVRQGWDEIIGSDGAFVGMTTFGASAPYKDLYKHFGLTAENVVAAARSSLAKAGRDTGAANTPGQ